MKLSIVRYRLSNGFTLIEILLVVVILLIVTAVTVPNFSPLIKKLELKQTTNDLAYLMRYAQSRAIVQNKNVRLAFGDDMKSFWLTQQSEPADDASLEESESENPQQTFERVSGRYGKTFHVPAQIELTFEDEAVDFWPDGRIAPAEIELCSGKQCLLVTTKGYRGKVNVIEYEGRS